MYEGLVSLNKAVIDEMAIQDYKDRQMETRIQKCGGKCNKIIYFIKVENLSSKR